MVFESRASAFLEESKDVGLEQVVGPAVGYGAGGNRHPGGRDGGSMSLTK